MFGGWHPLFSFYDTHPGFWKVDRLLSGIRLSHSKLTRLVIEISFTTNGVCLLFESKLSSNPYIFVSGGVLLLAVFAVWTN